MSTLDYESLAAATPWFVNEHGTPMHLIAMDAPPAPSPEFTAAFPRLTRLLAAARWTGLVYERETFLLLGWTLPIGKQIGWVCNLPTADPALSLHPSHRLLLSDFGGIDRTWVEDWETTAFTSYLDNLTWALGERETLSGSDGSEGSNIREAAEFYEEMCADEEVEPIRDIRDYRCFAQEANGDWYLYHKQTAELLLVSHDLAFNFVEPLHPLDPSELDLPIYRYKELSTLTDWIEHVAGQWLDAIAGSVG